MTPMLGIMASQISGHLSTPPPISGYKLWLDATIPGSITSSGGAVSQWNDQSANGYNFVQATGANQPITGTRTINGKNVIDFDGTNDYMSSNNAASAWAFLNNSSGSTTFIVGFRDTSAATGALLATNGSSSANIGYDLETNGNDTTYAEVTAGGGGVVSRISAGPTITDNTSFYLTVISDTGASTANRLFIAVSAGTSTGGNTDTATASASNPTYTLSLGARNAPSTYWNGTIGEVLIYSGVMSGANITSTKSYLATKWGI